MTKLINLGELTRGGEVHNLSGHERGLAARAHFELDAADVGPEPVEVVVPPDVYTLTPSFFQGMFANSVTKAGNRPNFLKRFSFKASPIVMRQIERGIASVGFNRGDVLKA
jgi:hypothetical protein